VVSDDPAHDVSPDVMTFDESGWIKLKELISSIGAGMMTTIDGDGNLASRPMLPMLREADQAIWFMTQTDTAKLRDLSHNARVNLTLVGSHGEFLSVSGRARLSRDRTVIQELWNPAYRAWFPGGPDDERLILVRLVVNQADYWHAPRSRVVRLFGMVKALVTRTPYETAARQRIVSND
jgi:general stress protein 26